VAIEFVGGLSSSRNGNSNATTSQSLTSLSGGIASAPAEGDLVIVACAVGSQDRNSDQAISGYSTLGTQLNRSDDTYDASMQVSYKVMGSSPDTSITIPAQGNAADGQAWAVMVFRGVDPDTPFDVASVSATGNNTARFDAPAITPSTAGAWIVIAGGGASSNGTTLYTAPTGFTDDWLAANGADTNDGSVGMGYYTGWTSGSYNPDVVGGGSTNTANSWVAWTMALRPAANEATGSLASSIGDVSLTAEGLTSGQLFYVVYPSAKAAPSAAQVKAGQDVDGSSAVASGSEWPPPSTGEYVFSANATGLTAGTSYRVAFVWSRNSVDSNVAVSDAWETDAAGSIGTLALSIGNITLDATGGVTADGTLSLSIGNVTLGATGGVTADGTLASSVGSIDLDAAGTVAVDGELDSSVGSIGLAAAGGVTADGELDSPIGDVTLDAAGVAHPNLVGTLASSIGDVTLDATGVAHPNLVGTLDSSIGSLALDADGGVTADGTLAASLGAIQLSSSALAVVSGTLTQPVGEIALSGAAQALVNGTLDQGLGSIVITAEGEVSITGTLTSSTGAITLLADGTAEMLVSDGTLDAALGDIGLAAAGTVEVTGTLNRSIGTLTLSGQGEVAIAGALSSSIGDVSLTGQGKVDIVGTLDEGIGELALDATGGAGNFGVLDAEIGAIGLSASGAVEVAGTLDLSTGAVTLSAAGGAVVTGTLTQSIGNLSLLATGITPVEGALSASVGAIVLSSTGAVDNVPIIGSLDLSIGDILLSDAQGDVTDAGSSEWIVRQRREAIR